MKILVALFVILAKAGIHVSKWSLLPQGQDVNSRLHGNDKVALAKSSKLLSISPSKIEILFGSFKSLLFLFLRDI
jgi:hypothetical protein